MSSSASSILIWHIGTLRLRYRLPLVVECCILLGSIVDDFYVFSMERDATNKHTPIRIPMHDEVSTSSSAAFYLKPAGWKMRICLSMRDNVSIQPYLPIRLQAAPGGIVSTKIWHSLQARQCQNCKHSPSFNHYFDCL